MIIRIRPTFGLLQQAAKVLASPGPGIALEWIDYKDIDIPCWLILVYRVGLRKGVVCVVLLLAKGSCLLDILLELPDARSQADSNRLRSLSHPK
jgi:hypothetical protein